MPRPRTHDDQLRRQLLDACSEIISTRGTQALTLRGLAATTGTTTAAIYTLFGGRGDLIGAVVAEGVARFSARLAAVGASDDPKADLIALGIAYRDSALADPHFYRIMFGAVPGSHAAQPKAEPEHSPFGVLVRAAGRAGAPNPTEAAYRLWALSHGLVSLELAGLLPPGDREAGYRRALLAAGPSLLR